MSTAPATPPEEKVRKMRMSAVSNRIDAAAGERNPISVVLAVMLAALAVFPVILYFGLLPPSLVQYLDVLFR
jgi:hypothetical protein